MDDEIEKQKQLAKEITQKILKRVGLMIVENKLQEAYKLCKYAISYDNNDPDIYLNLAKIKLALNDSFALIANSLFKALELTINNPIKHLEVAINMLEIHNFCKQSKSNEKFTPILKEKATVILKKNLEHVENKTDIYILLGKMALHDNNFNEALHFFTKVIEIAPHNGTAFFYLDFLKNNPEEKFI